MSRRSGYLEIATCTLAWGSIGSIVKTLTLSAGVIVFFRLFLGMLLVLAWMAVRGRIGELRPHARPLLLIGSGVALGVHWLLLFEAFKRLDVASTILIVFLGPVLMATAAPAVLHERLRPAAVGALGLAVGGIGLITIPDIADVDGLGVLLALGSAVLFAALLLVGKLLTHHYRPPVLVVWQLGVGAVVVAPLLTAASVGSVLRAAPGLVLLGVGFTGILGILFFRALTALQAQRLGVLFYLEPASAVLYAWLLLSEQPSALKLAGGALVVIAGLIVVVTDRGDPVPMWLPDPEDAARADGGTEAPASR